MQIKSAVNIPRPVDVSPIEKKLKSAASDERDANGKQEQASQEEQRRKKLTPDELEKALEKLRSLDGIKNNNLTVRLVQEGDLTFALVEDLTGKIVRRIPEIELWYFSQEKGEDNKGHLLDKAG